MLSIFFNKIIFRIRFQWQPLEGFLHSVWYREEDPFGLVYYFSTSRYKIPTYYYLTLDKGLYWTCSDRGHNGKLLSYYVIITVFFLWRLFSYCFGPPPWIIDLGPPTLILPDPRPLVPTLDVFRDSDQLTYAVKVPVVPTRRVFRVS